MRSAGAFGAAVITAILAAADIELATRELLDAVTI
jgi:thiamine monophosphate synthase